MKITTSFAAAAADDRAVTRERRGSDAGARQSEAQTSGVPHVMKAKAGSSKQS